MYVYFVIRFVVRERLYGIYNQIKANITALQQNTYSNANLIILD